MRCRWIGSPKQSLPDAARTCAGRQGRRTGLGSVRLTYFTPRQLVALTTFSDLVGEAMERVRHDAVAAEPAR